MRKVPHPLTEEAVQLLHMTLIDHERSVRTETRNWGRIIAHGSRLGAHSPIDVGRNACLLRMVSIVEAYADLMSSEMFVAGTSGGNDLVRRLLAEVEIRSSSTWANRQSAFKEYHGIRLPTVDRWAQLQAAIQARNAVAHGLGTLTARQRSGNTVKSLARIRIDVRDQRIFVTSLALRRIRDDLLRFVRDLDSKIQDR